MNEDALNYTVIISWCYDKLAFVARVPALPGCMAYGDTRALAIEQIEIAIENWLDADLERARKAVQTRYKNALQKLKDA